VGSSFTRKDKTRKEICVRVQHSSLLRQIVNCAAKKLCNTVRSCVVKWKTREEVCLSLKRATLNWHCDIWTGDICFNDFSPTDPKLLCQELGAYYYVYKYRHKISEWSTIKWSTDIKTKLKLLYTNNLAYFAVI